MLAVTPCSGSCADSPGASPTAMLPRITRGSGPDEVAHVDDRGQPPEFHRQLVVQSRRGRRRARRGLAHQRVLVAQRQHLARPAWPAAAAGSAPGPAGCWSRAISGTPRRNASADVVGGAAAGVPGQPRRRNPSSLAWRRPSAVAVPCARSSDGGVRARPAAGRTASPRLPPSSRTSPPRARACVPTSAKPRFGEGDGAARARQQRAVGRDLDVVAGQRHAALDLRRVDGRRSAASASAARRRCRCARGLGQRVARHRRDGRAVDDRQRLRPAARAPRP